MSLQQKLDVQKEEIETSASKDALEVMHRATEDLAISGILQPKFLSFYKFLGFKSVFYQKNFTLQINSSLMYNILK
jgi:hypothetical protein